MNNKRLKISIFDGWAWFVFLFVFVVLGVSYLIYLQKMYTTTNVKLDSDINIVKVIWDELTNVYTIGSGGFCIVAEFLAEKNFKNKIWTKRIVAILIFFFFYLCRVLVSIRVSLEMYSLAISLFYLFSLVLIVISMHNGSLLNSLDKGWLRVVLGKINNRNIVSVQLYELKQSRIDGYENYVFQYIDGIYQEGMDVNGIISQKFQIKSSYIDLFRATLCVYRNFIDDGDTETRKTMMEMIEKNKNSIIEQLEKIKSVDDVGKEECCLARLYLIYLTLQSRIEDSGSFGISIPERSIRLSNSSIEDKLFSAYRTGMLGAVELGIQDIYQFNYYDYEKTSPKSGRKYCAFQLDVNDMCSKYICMIVLRENENIHLTYDLVEVIRKIERRINEGIEKKAVVYLCQ